jgi:hypothetical protein
VSLSLCFEILLAAGSVSSNTLTQKKILIKIKNCIPGKGYYYVSKTGLGLYIGALQVNKIIHFFFHFFIFSLTLPTQFPMWERGQNF